VNMPIQAPAIDRNGERLLISVPPNDGIRSSLCDGVLCYCGSQVACCATNKCHIDKGNHCVCG
jgi:hypothetical protein